MHRLLRARSRHVSAEELLSEASERLPGVSLPTVYAALKLFEQLDIVRRVNGGGGTLLWDTRPDAHHHMICRNCGRIGDMDTPLDLEAPAGPPRAPASNPTAPRSSSAGSARPAPASGGS
jgi:Fe2+ or Zn2+ uptake regulation protein